MSDLDPQTHLADDATAEAPRPAASGAQAPEGLTADPHDGSGAAVTVLPDDPAALREEGRERQAWDEDTVGDADR